MTDKELAAQLRQMKVNTKGIICLGCKYQNNCGIYGCTIIKAAEHRLTRVSSALCKLRAAYKDETDPILRQHIGVCLELFGPLQE